MSVPELKLASLTSKKEFSKPDKDWLVFGNIFQLQIIIDATFFEIYLPA